MMRASFRFPALLLSLALAGSSAYAATGVSLVGLFPNKAVVVIDGQSPRTMTVGEKSAAGVTLLATTSSNATFKIDGKTHTLDVGQTIVGSTRPAPSADAGAARGGSAITLAADPRGHFVTLGQINGKSIQFLVDTGASAVSIPASFAQSAGIDYRAKGQLGYAQTANGVAPVYRVALDSVTLGEVTLYQVEGLVHEGGALGVALLGMSFLNRMEMRRDGAAMTLTKRY